ncbi:MAG TPA: TetR/AcrR family transcriptional regulator [Nevskiaceae bacterium]|nr:TetR/AcrR family transcriptional regulator [Nevskiaceae bacterium]
MARTREFDEDVALDRALEVFWSAGYKAASLEQLLEATGLSRSSLYQTFGNKRRLLMECLRFYANKLWTGPIAPLVRDDAGRAQIEAVLKGAIDRAGCADGQRGCFINNCLAEIAPHDPVILRAVRTVMARLEGHMGRAVANGQADGTIRSRETPEALAHFLVNTLSGLNLAAKSRPPPERLENIVRVALRALD